MKFESLINLYRLKTQCNSCKLRRGCIQVVPGIGSLERPSLVIIGECPGQEEDLEGKPFIGRSGQLLREVLRETKVLNRRNTLITNILGCRPPKNKFPTDETPSICVSKWLDKEIELAKPARMLLVGGQALKHVAGKKGITACRGQWYDVKGIRTMATFHPSYVLRQEGEGKNQFRSMLERDVGEVALEVAEIEKERAGEEWRREHEDHVSVVASLLSRISDEVNHRGRIHDASKTEEPEYGVFSKYTGKLRRVTYGSDEYKENLKRIKPALDHHYAENRHHVEFHENGIGGMNLVDLVEMICDWKAATRRHDDGNIERSIKVNAERFGIDPQLVSVLRNTVKWLEEK